MNLDITRRHFHADAELDEFAKKKVGKLEHLLEEPVEIRWILATEKKRCLAELHLSHRHATVVVEGEGEDMRDAIAAAVAKAEIQLQKSRKKHQDTRRRVQRQAAEDRHWPFDVIEAESVAAGQVHRVIKKSTLKIDQMSVDEASDQLERSKNDFFVFQNSSNERVSVLYKRRDGNLGLIVPEH
jgi:putative sigma-54 modulation protein